MMRRRRRVLFPVVALVCVTIIGSGFAVWSFRNEMREAVEINVLVRESRLDGEFTYTLPSVVVLDEGVSGGVSSTITGITFYKKGIHPVTGKTEVLADTDLSVAFTEFEDNPDDMRGAKLHFGCRVSVNGPLEDYLTYTSSYFNVENEKTEYFSESDVKPLRKLALTYTYDMDTYVHTFQLTTTLLSSWFTYQPDKRPTTAEGYDVIRESILGNPEPSYFLIELWEVADLELI